MNLRWTSLLIGFALLASAIALTRPATPLHRDRAEVKRSPLIRQARTPIKRFDAAEPVEHAVSHVAPPVVLPTRLTIAVPRTAASIVTTAANLARPDVCTAICRARAPPVA